MSSYRYTRDKLSVQSDSLMGYHLSGHPLYKRGVRSGGGPAKKSCKVVCPDRSKPRIEYYLPTVEELERLSRGNQVGPIQQLPLPIESELETIRRRKCEGDARRLGVECVASDT